MRASDYIGRTAYDREGNALGRVADLITARDAEGGFRVTAALITPRHRGRLLGFERPGIQAPWVLEKLSRLLHRGTREIPWSDLRLGPPHDHGS